MSCRLLTPRCHDTSSEATAVIARARHNNEIIAAERCTIWNLFLVVGLPSGGRGGWWLDAAKEDTSCEWGELCRSRLCGGTSPSVSSVMSASKAWSSWSRVPFRGVQNNDAISFRRFRESCVRQSMRHGSRTQGNTPGNLCQKPRGVVGASTLHEAEGIFLRDLYTTSKIRMDDRI